MDQNQVQEQESSIFMSVLISVLGLMEGKKECIYLDQNQLEN